MYYRRRSTASHLRESALKKITSFTQNSKLLHLKSLTACYAIYQGFISFQKQTFLRLLRPLSHLKRRHTRQVGELRIGERDLNFITEKILNSLVSLLCHVYFLYSFHLRIIQTIMTMFLMNMSEQSYCQIRILQMVIYVLLI